MIDAVSLSLLISLTGAPAEVDAPAVRQTASRPSSQPSEPNLRAGERIVAMGDSITQAGGYLRVVDKVLATQYPELKIPKVINAGISGNKAEDMIARFENDVIAREPDIVTINVGINDVWHRLGEPHDPQVLRRYAANLRKMVEMAREAGARVIILSPTVIEEDPTSEGNHRLQMYIRAGQDVARETKSQYVNLHEMFMKVVKSKKRLERPAEPSGGGQLHRQLTTDGVHMKPMGDTLMAVGVLRALGVPDEKIGATDLSGVFGE